MTENESAAQADPDIARDSSQPQASVPSLDVPENGQHINVVQPAPSVVAVDANVPKRSHEVACPSGDVNANDTAESSTNVTVLWTAMTTRYCRNQSRNQVRTAMVNH